MPTPLGRARRFRPALEMLEGRDAPAVLTVTNLNEGGPGSLRSEIGLAQNGDSIRFAADLRGTILLVSGELLLTRSVGIVGPGVGVLTVSGNDSSRVFEVASGASAAISGLTITHGKAAYSRTVETLPGYFINYYEGGGVYVNAGAALALTACAVTDCRTVPPSLSGVAVGQGGGVGSGGTLTVTNCTVARNAAVPSGPYTANGGGLEISGGTAAVIGSTVANNTVTDGGAGIYNDRAILTVTGSAIANNTAYGHGYTTGGGVYNYGGTVTVTDSTLSDNYASAQGGGIDNYHGTVTVTGGTLVGNRSTRGGGLDQYPGLGSTTLHRTIVAGNTRAADSTHDDIFATVTAASDHNLVGDGTGLTGIDAGSNGNLIGTAASPIDPLLGPLASNGGPARTRTLRPGSPAIDAGGPSAGSAPDQRGSDRTAKANLDIGAVGFGLRAGRGVFAAATGPGGSVLNIYAADGTLRSTLTPYPGFTGGVQMVVGDVFGIGRDYVVTAPNAGGSPEVHVYDLYGNLVSSFDAYDANFYGGIQVALADIQGTGAKSIVTVPNSGGSPEVRTFTGRGQLLYAFNAYDPRFTGGITVVAADTTGNGYDNLITVPGRGGSPEVRVFDGRSPVHTSAGLGQPDRGAFNAYDVRFTGGVSIAAGDTEGQGYANIVTAPGAGGSPEVHVYDGKGLGLLKVFSAYDVRFTGGVQLAVADTLGQGRASILTVPGAGGTAEVRLFDTRSATVSVPTNLFPAFEPTYAAGVTLAVRDLGDLGYARIVTARAAGSAANVRVFDTYQRKLLQDFVAFDPAFIGGVSLG